MDLSLVLKWRLLHAGSNMMFLDDALALLQSLVGRQSSFPLHGKAPEALYSPGYLAAALQDSRQRGVFPSKAGKDPSLPGTEPGTF